MEKSLIVYFSRAGNNYVSGSIQYLTKGNTEIVAEMIQRLTGADLYEIKPVIPYSIDYQECVSQAKHDFYQQKRPAFKYPPLSLDGYDKIYIGYPNYCGTMPMPVFTFLESYDFSNKIIKPFCTHEGSGLGHSEQDLKQVCPNAIFEKGLAIVGSRILTAENLIKKWI